MHAEAVLLVDDGERQIVERHVLLEQSMGADDQIDLAGGEARKNFRPFAPALAAGENGDADAGGGRQRRDSLEMLAGENFRRRHERRLAAGFDHGRGGEQSHQRLAGADIAVQQPQHAVRLRQVGDDVGYRAVLRGRQRIGQGGDDLGPQQPFGGAAAAGAFAHMAAQQRQRKLAGEQLVIGEPRPRGALRLQVGRRRRMMNAAQRLGKARETHCALATRRPATPADPVCG